MDKITAQSLLPTLKIPFFHNSTPLGFFCSEANNKTYRCVSSYYFSLYRNMEQVKKARRKGRSIGRKLKAGRPPSKKDAPAPSSTKKRSADFVSVDTTTHPPTKNARRQEQHDKDALSGAVERFCEPAASASSKAALCEAIMSYLLSLVDERVAQESWDQAIKKHRSATSAGSTSTTEDRLSPPIEDRTSSPTSSVVRVAPLLNLDAFLLGQNGELRSGSAASTAMNKQKDVIKTAILNAGTFAQQVIALKAALYHPGVQAVAAHAGFVVANKEKVTLNQMTYLFNNIRTMVQFAMTTSRPNGRPNDDKSAFVENIVMALVQPKGEPKNASAPSDRNLAHLIGLTATTGRRRVLIARQKRLEMLSANGDLRREQWTSLRTKKKKECSKITPDLKERLVQWMIAHPNVIQSPIVKDTILVDGVPTQKLLREISIRELHNMLVMPEIDGGLKGATEANGKVVVSDTSFTRIIKKYLPQLRRATERHKQMCGCEICITVRLHKRYLTAWQKRMVRKLEAKAEEVTSTAKEREDSANYKDYVFNCPEKASDDVKTIMCPEIKIGTCYSYPHMRCTLRRCETCPLYKQHENEQIDGADENIPPIAFHTYAKMSNCSIHGQLENKKSKCAECEDRPNGKSKGTVTSKKELVKLTKPIGVFMQRYYLKVLDDYAHHLPHVKLLGKKGCGEMRHNVFLMDPNSIKTHRDYAERLKEKFNFQIQSGHFGDTRQLSIEGCSLLMHDLEKILEFETGLIELEDLKQWVTMEFHSHFADESKQNAASTHTNMEVLIQLLIKNGRFKTQPLILDHTDGCAKQYRCGTALYLMSLLSALYGVAIDRMIGAPGHGKDIVDAVNATTKRKIAKFMCNIANSESDDANRQDRIRPEAFADDTKFSFAAESKRLMDATSSEGVKSAGKHAKREAAAPLKKRVFHISEMGDDKYANLKMVITKGLKKTKKGEKYWGIGAMHNIRTDRELGIGKAAVRRIPCGCEQCVEQMKKPIEERYSPTTNCRLYSIFEGLNDWNVVKLGAPKDAGQAAEEEEGYSKIQVLESMTLRAALEIKSGNIGTFSTTNDETDGYYVVEWVSEPYTIEEDCTLNEYDVPIELCKGELVVKAKYLNPVPRAPKWYTPSELEVVV